MTQADYISATVNVFNAALDTYIAAFTLQMGDNAKLTAIEL